MSFLGFSQVSFHALKLVSFGQQVSVTVSSSSHKTSNLNSLPLPARYPSGIPLGSVVSAKTGLWFPKCCELSGFVSLQNEIQIK